MKIISNEHLVAFDVDWTLIEHLKDGTPDDETTLYINNPYSNTLIRCKEIKEHTELMKQYKGRNLFVIVWSKAGVLWAEKVIQELGLEHYVDLAMTKLDRFVDDLPAEKIMGERVFLK